MKLAEYASYDAMGLAGLVAAKQISPKELAETAFRAIESVNPSVHAVVESYPDRINDLDEGTLGGGPFRGVPFLMKDVFGHEAGRKIEFGSRLCQGMVAQSNSYLYELFHAAGLNIIGRSATPEFSMSCATETALYGNTSNPWKQGYSAGGSTGGGMAAVMAGIVPIAHGSDIAGSIRVPASYCGGVGLKPSRGRVSFGPLVDENGYGMATNFIQAKTIRDCASMLDSLSIPQIGDPFFIPKPAESYAAIASRQAPRLSIGWSTKELMNLETDAEVARAVQATATLLSEMGHEVCEESPQFDAIAAMRALADVWFFGLHLKLESFAQATGRRIGPDTLEPVVLMLYGYSKQIGTARFLQAMAILNQSRRDFGRYFSKYDVWLSPTTARVAEPWGKYNLGRTDLTIDTVTDIYYPTCEFTVPYNVAGTPSISLPLSLNSAGLPIGIQLGTKPADEHILLQLAAALEQAMPWKDRVPPLHVSRI